MNACVCIYKYIYICNVLCTTSKATLQTAKRHKAHDTPSGEGRVTEHNSTQHNTTQLNTTQHNTEKAKRSSGTELRVSGDPQKRRTQNTQRRTHTERTTQNTHRTHTEHTAQQLRNKSGGNPSVCVIEFVCVNRFRLVSTVALLCAVDENA